MREGKRWRERFSRRLTDAELFTVPCQPHPILKMMHFTVHLKGMIQGTCPENGQKIYLNMHFDNNHVGCSLLEE